MTERMATVLRVASPAAAGSALAQRQMLDLEHGNAKAVRRTMPGVPGAHGLQRAASAKRARRKQAEHSRRMNRRVR